MEDSFELALEFVILAEGGISNNLNDPGGLTKYGISQAAYPNLDITSLTLEAVKVLYRRDYWDMCKCSELPAALAVIVFDTAVNLGVSEAIRILQRSLKISGTPEIIIDGIIGGKTLRAVSETTAKHNLNCSYLVNRVLKYSEFAGFTHFGKGWIRRVVNLAFYIAELKG